MRFYGNEICCGSYACLNLMQDPQIDLALFEVSTSTPFGIKHIRNSNLNRLLTTFNDPNKGLDFAIKAFGYDVEREDFAYSHEAISVLISWLSEDTPVLLGPLDMGELYYYPAASISRGMDHYIVAVNMLRDSILCMDSEGFVGFQVKLDALQGILSVKNIPEANNHISLRRAIKKRDWSKHKVLRTAFVHAAENIVTAEACGQGSNAIMKCKEFLEDYNFYRWKLPFMYDVQYLKQRKLLLIWLLEEMQNVGQASREYYEKGIRLAEKQSELLSQVYSQLYKGFVDWLSLQEVARIENKLACWFASKRYAELLE